MTESNELVVLSDDPAPRLLALQETPLYQPQPRLALQETSLYQPQPVFALQS